MKPKKGSPVVGIVMGSDSDLPVMQEAAKVLAEFGVECEMTVASAHRSPERAARFAPAAEAAALVEVVAEAFRARKDRMSA